MNDGQFLYSTGVPRGWDFPEKARRRTGEGGMASNPLQILPRIVTAPRPFRPSMEMGIMGSMRSMWPSPGPNDELVRGDGTPSPRPPGRTPSPPRSQNRLPDKLPLRGLRGVTTPSRPDRAGEALECGGAVRHERRHRFPLTRARPPTLNRPVRPARAPHSSRRALGAGGRFERPAPGSLGSPSGSSKAVSRHRTPYIRPSLSTLSIER